MAARKRATAKTKRRTGTAGRSGTTRSKPAKTAAKALKKKSKKTAGRATAGARKSGKKPATKKIAKKKPVVKKKPAARKKPVAKKKAAAKKTAKKVGKKKTGGTTRKASASRVRVKKAGPGKVRAGTKAARGRPASSRKPASSKRREPAQRRRLSTFTEAVKIYEAAVRLMHAEKFDRARGEFDRLIIAYPAETELVERANVLIQACDNRIREAQSGPRLKGANDYYEVGVAEMNNGALEDAREHLEHALKLLPRADHVLYALAALACLRGERQEALDYLSRAIAHREENRYLAVNDVDFESLSEDPEFLKLVSSWSP